MANYPPSVRMCHSGFHHFYHQLRQHNTETSDNGSTLSTFSPRSGLCSVQRTTCPRPSTRAFYCIHSFQFSCRVRPKKEYINFSGLNDQDNNHNEIHDIICMLNKCTTNSFLLEKGGWFAVRQDMVVLQSPTNSGDRLIWPRTF